MKKANDELINKLLNGVNDGNLKKLIFKITDINQPLKSSFNALHLSVLGGNIEIVKLVLSHKDINPNIVIDINKNNYDKEESLDINPNEPVTLNKTLEDEFFDELKQLGDVSAIHIAVKKSYSSISELLLKHKADPNLTDQGKCTPLHWAVSQNDLKLVELLLKYKANVNSKDFIDSTPLHEAVRRNNIEIIESLIEYCADPNIKDTFGHDAFYYSNNDQNIINILLKNSNACPNGLTQH